jgi:hypothetical protein
MKMAGVNLLWYGLFMARSGETSCYTLTMATKTVYLHWNPEEQFILKDDLDHGIIMKRPEGVSASDLLTMSLAGCASHDVVEILNKQRQGLQ